MVSLGCRQMNADIISVKMTSSPWCETPGSRPWSRCGRRCRGRCEGWFPSAGGRAVCPEHSNRYGRLNASQRGVLRGTSRFRGGIKTWCKDSEAEVLHYRLRGQIRELKRALGCLSLWISAPAEVICTHDQWSPSWCREVNFFPLKVYNKNY